MILIVYSTETRAWKTFFGRFIETLHQKGDNFKVFDDANETTIQGIIRAIRVGNYKSYIIITSEDNALDWEQKFRQVFQMPTFCFELKRFDR